jgi:hypothetical protein
MGGRGWKYMYVNRTMLAGRVLVVKVSVYSGSGGSGSRNSWEGGGGSICVLAGQSWRGWCW